MFSSNLFYTKKALESIQPFIRRTATAQDHVHAQAHQYLADPDLSGLGTNKQLREFPVRFTNRKEKAKQIKFYEKYLSPKIFKQSFTDILLAASKLSHNQIAIPKQAEIMEPSLLQKMRRGMSISQNRLDIDSVEIKSTGILAHCIFKGAFMHRALNMPAQCYSVEVVDEKNVVFRMRSKMSNSRHIILLNQKKLEKFYLDSYENFAKNQKLARTLIEVNAIIKGKFTTKDGRMITLPTGEGSPITTHLLQLEKIQVPGRSDREKSLVTDIDYYMQGNPFTS